jgi:hypothetical protein
MREALFAIAELAAPENQSPLEDAVFNAPLALGLRENDNGKIHLAAQQIGVLKICQLLAEFDLTLLKSALEKDPDGFLDLLLTLPKLGQSGMSCEQLNLAVAELKSKIANAKLPRSSRIASREELMDIAHDMKLL